MCYLKKNKVIILFFLSLLLFSVLVITDRINITYPVEKNTALLFSESTKLTLHLSTHTVQYDITPSPKSSIIYFDAEGNVLDQYTKEEEVIGDFIVSTKLNDYYFFKNETHIVNRNETKIFPNQSEITIDTINIGPSRVGYISEYETAYSLFNVGTKNGEYINILRFTSQTHTYDVIIPYYLEFVCYDETEKQFICCISSLNKGIESEGFSYLTLQYNQTSGCFEKTTEVFTIPDLSYNFDNLLYRYGMVKEDKLYLAVLTKRMSNFDTINSEIYGDLFLQVYDLKEKRVISTQNLLNNYYLGKLGLGLMTGSSDLPICEKDGSLYVFTSEERVYKISDETKIEEIDMPFVFSDAYNTNSPLDIPTVKRSDFWGSLISVGENGNIYVLNLYENNIIRIYKLLDNSYELVYECKIPNGLLEGLTISSFEWHE